MSTGMQRYNETWWWNFYVQEKIKMKGNAKKRYDQAGIDEDKESRLAKKEDKVAVAQSKPQAMANVYEDTDINEGQKNIYKFVKGRNKSTKEITHIKQMKNEDGVLVCRSSGKKRTLNQ
ncbi:uncharacterized protein [Palaemon carinicauda]|uniref:uncharacterized protein n=1 Tax=Palaemon carinicauda TaxID=392227 RepID=UPI0035B64678